VHAVDSPKMNGTLWLEELRSLRLYNFSFHQQFRSANPLFKPNLEDLVPAIQSKYF